MSVTLNFHQINLERIVVWLWLIQHCWWKASCSALWFIYMKPNMVKQLNQRKSMCLLTKEMNFDNLGCVGVVVVAALRKNFTQNGNFEMRPSGKCWLFDGKLFLRESIANRAKIVWFLFANILHVNILAGDIIILKINVPWILFVCLLLCVLKAFVVAYIGIALEARSCVRGVCSAHDICSPQFWIRYEWSKQ